MAELMQQRPLCEFMSVLQSTFCMFSMGTFGDTNVVTEIQKGRLEEET